MTATDFPKTIGGWSFIVEALAELGRSEIERRERSGQQAAREDGKAKDDRQEALPVQHNAQDGGA